MNKTQAQQDKSILFSEFLSFLAYNGIVLCSHGVDGNNEAIGLNELKGLQDRYVDHAIMMTFNPRNHSRN